MCADKNKKTEKKKKKLPVLLYGKCAKPGKLFNSLLQNCLTVKKDQLNKDKCMLIFTTDFVTKTWMPSTLVPLSKNKWHK